MKIQFDINRLDGLKHNLQWQFGNEVWLQRNQDILGRLKYMECNKPKPDYEFYPKLLKGMMMGGDFHFFFTDLFNLSNLNKRLEELAKDGLLVNEWSREVFSRGFDCECMRLILVKEPLFEQYLKEIKENVYVGHGFVT